MGYFKFYLRLFVGKMFRVLHKRQFSKSTTFYGIPCVNRFENLLCGDELKVNGNVYINTDGGVIIGDRVTLSYGVSILAATYDKEQFFKGRRVHNNKGIKIGNDVWIGANATILDGVNICNNVIIGAGSVVTRSITSQYSIYAGIPAKQIYSEE